MSALVLEGSTRTLAVVMVCIAASTTGPRAALADESTPGSTLEPGRTSWAVGLDVLEPLSYGLISTSFKNSMLLPFPFHAHVSFGGYWGLATGITYRYHKDGNVLSLHEVAAGIGPRVSFTGTGVEGAYLALVVGFGYAAGSDYAANDYHRVDLLIEPEVGYAWVFGGRPGFYLALGLGLRTLVPLSETPTAIGWNSLGKLLQYYAPSLRLTLGAGG